MYVWKDCVWPGWLSDEIILLSWKEQSIPPLPTSLYAFNPNIREAETGKSEFEAILVYKQVAGGRATQRRPTMKNWREKKKWNLSGFKSTPNAVTLEEWYSLGKLTFTEDVYLKGKGITAVVTSK